MIKLMDKNCDAALKVYAGRAERSGSVIRVEWNSTQKEKAPQVLSLQIFASS